MYKHMCIHLFIHVYIYIHTHACTVGRRGYVGFCSDFFLSTSYGVGRLREHPSQKSLVCSFLRTRAKGLAENLQAGAVPDVPSTQTSGIYQQP